MNFEDKDELAAALGVVPGGVASVAIIDEEQWPTMWAEVGEDFASYEDYAAARAGWARLLADAGALVRLVPVNGWAWDCWLAGRGVEPDTPGLLDVFADSCPDEQGIAFVPGSIQDEVQQVLDASLVGILRRAPVASQLAGRITPSAHALAESISNVIAADAATNGDVATRVVLVVARGSHVPPGKLWIAASYMNFSPDRLLVRPAVVALGINVRPAAGKGLPLLPLATALSVASVGAGIMTVTRIVPGDVTVHGLWISNGTFAPIPADELDRALALRGMPAASSSWPPTTPVS